MLIKDCIYVTIFLLALFLIMFLIYSLKNNDKYICRNIIFISSLYIIYLFICLILIDILYIPVGFDVLHIYLIIIISGILYVISLILNLKKVKNNTKDNRFNRKIIFLTMMLLMIWPSLFLSVNILKNKYIIDNSNLVLVYHSINNGGIGDGNTFAYAIGDDFCKQFDLGIDIDGYYLKKFLSKNVSEIEKINDYEIVFNNDNTTIIYKDNKKFCKINNRINYFNVNFKRGYYIKH